MTPFKIPETGRWVDLDTIQSISEPEIRDMHSIVLTWRHAFRDRPDSVYFMASEFYDYDSEEMRKSYEENGYDATVLKECKRKVFDCFFSAWLGKEK